MRQKIFAFPILLLLVFSFLFMPGSSDAATKTMIRVSHGQPEDHPDHVAMMAFADHINSKLGDRFEVKVYGNALLGDSKNALELCQTGAINYVICSTSNLEAYSKLYGLFSIPYLFSNKEAYFKFMDGGVVKNMYNSTNRGGFTAVTWFDAGVRSFYAQVPIRKPEDMKGMKIRVQPSPLNVAMIQSLGAGAVPMGFGEVYTALQQGTIDGAENNELALTTVKHGEVIKYYSYDMHQMQPDMLVANNMFLESLTDEERAVFDEATEIAHEVELVAWAEQVEETITIAKEKMNVTFIEADVAAFQRACASIREDYLKKNPEVGPYLEEIDRCNSESSQ